MRVEGSAELPAADVVREPLPPALVFEARPQIPFRLRDLSVFGPLDCHALAVTELSLLRWPDGPRLVLGRSRKAPPSAYVRELLALDRPTAKEINVGDTLSLTVALETILGRRPVFPVAVGEALYPPRRSVLGFRPLNFAVPYSPASYTSQPVPRARLRGLTIEPERGADALDLHLLDVVLGKDSLFLTADPVPVLSFGTFAGTFPLEGRMAREGERITFSLLNLATEPRRFRYAIELDP